MSYRAKTWIDRTNCGELSFTEIRSKFNSIDWPKIAHIQHWNNSEYVTFPNSHESIVRDDCGGISFSKGEQTFFRVLRVPSSGKEISQDTPFDIEVKLHVPYKTIFGNTNTDMKYTVLWPIASDEVILKLIKLYVEDRIVELWDNLMLFINSHRDGIFEPTSDGHRPSEILKEIRMLSMPVNKQVEEYILRTVD